MCANGGMHDILHPNQFMVSNVLIIIGCRDFHGPNICRQVVVAVLGSFKLRLGMEHERYLLIRSYDFFNTSTWISKKTSHGPNCTVRCIAK